MDKKSITILCNCRFPSTAAHSTYLARLCESFAAQGRTVELVVPKRFKEIKADPLKYYSVKTPFAVKKIWSFDFVIFGAVLGRLAFILQYLDFYASVLLYFLFRSRRRVIYTMDNLGCLLTFLGYKVVFEAHAGIGNFRKRALPLLKRSAGVVVTSSIIAHEFESVGFLWENILIAPNGVDLALFSGSESKAALRQTLGLPAAKKIIAYVGKYRTMGMEKGVEELIAVFGALLKNHADIHLLLVGFEPHEEMALQTLLGQAGVAPADVSLVSHVPQTAVARYMKASDILVMNYPNKEHYAYFMSPMKMFEYMAARRPIVASDLPSIREMLDENTAVFVKPDDRASLREGIEKLLADERLGVVLADAAYGKVSEYTWDKRAEKILKFIGV